LHFKNFCYEKEEISMTGHVHQHKRVNLGEFDSEEDILDAIEQSRRITRLIISAVQKGSKFEVSQILEHYGLAMTSRLHFKVVNIVMEQWFSLMGIEDEEQIWGILAKNKYAMNKLRQIRPQGMMVLSDMLTEWELPIGALQSKIIRRVQDYVDCTKAPVTDAANEANDANDANDTGDTNYNNNDNQNENESNNKPSNEEAPAVDADGDTEAADNKEVQTTDNNNNEYDNNNSNSAEAKPSESNTAAADDNKQKEEN
jgi:hypothetical protein